MKKLLFVFTLVLFVFGCDTRYDVLDKNHTRVPYKYITKVHEDTSCSQVAISEKYVYFQKNGKYGSALITSGTDYMKMTPDILITIMFFCFGFGIFVGANLD